MAGSDYQCCSVCGAKCSYNANLAIVKASISKTLCVECSKTFEIIIRRKKSKREVKNRESAETFIERILKNRRS